MGVKELDSRMGNHESWTSYLDNHARACAHMARIQRG